MLEKITPCTVFLIFFFPYTLIFARILLEAACSALVLAQRRTYDQLAATFPLGIRHFFSWNPSRTCHFFLVESQESLGIIGFFLWNPGIPETWNPGIPEIGILESRNPGNRNSGILETRNPVAVF